MKVPKENSEGLCFLHMDSCSRCASDASVSVALWIVGNERAYHFLAVCCFIVYTVFFSIFVKFLFHFFYCLFDIKSILNLFHYIFYQSTLKSRF